MLPGQAGRIKAVEISLGDQALCQEIVVLLGSRTWAENVEGSPSGGDRSEHVEVTIDGLFSILGETQDVGEVRSDAMLFADPDDIVVGIGTILFLIGGD